ncbi:hypothetical protein Aab01nite_81420 [Paractinoplanes abujensis]|uniref:D-glycero-D-manno-heptose 1,7-bisphosphate phosphatase n=1 Tax=Paractinoplanes abujensis TaxID=882441 RepID=A0A7W7CU59_9ACTN|nr:HAD-IIIA family hydrolase [Actinoplanes abujensis]MBB4693348.1 D-glycero-D-manno-heptose 1,7-bisphosphate phosphatase [Actinoplanes abujensis]GID24552.1 hypothetical protein Aab01nite_81420 [Actinoplanes abujensis]
MTLVPAVFFDLGGTLLALDGDEIARDERGRVTVLPGVRERLAVLAGSPVFVVTNQAGVAEGTLTERQLQADLAQLSQATGGAVTDWAACTHRRDAGCVCRKPRTGLVEGLARTHGIDLTRSTMVGDSPADQQMAVAAGMARFVWAADYFG